MAINALDDISFTIPSMTDSMRAEWSGGALSLPPCANSTASPIKQLRWLKMRPNPAGAADAIDQDFDASHKIEFIFLNDNLIASASQLPTFNRVTVPCNHIRRRARWTTVQDTFIYK
jgi:hypothetical protein